MGERRINGFKVIIIGIGGIGEAWVSVIKNFKGWHISGLVGHRKTRVRKIAQKHGIPLDNIFIDYRTAIRKLDAEAVLIATPTETHKELILESLHAGLHVLCEKPLATTMIEAKELLKESKKFNLKLMINQNYRWWWFIQSIKKYLDKGMIGKISYLNYEFHKCSHFGGWREKLEDILLEDMAIHHFDLMRYLTGKDCLEVYANSFKPRWSWFNGNPCASVLLKFEDGIYVNYFGSWVARGKESSWHGDIRIVGEKGTIYLGSDNRPVAILTNKTGIYQLEKVKMHYSDLKYTLHEFRSSILEDRLPEINIEDNIKTLTISWAAIKSSKDGKPVVTLRK